MKKRAANMARVRSVTLNEMERREGLKVSYGNVGVSVKGSTATMLIWLAIMLAALAFFSDQITTQHAEIVRAMNRLTFVNLLTEDEKKKIQAGMPAELRDALQNGTLGMAPSGKDGERSSWWFRKTD